MRKKKRWLMTAVLAAGMLTLAGCAGKDDGQKTDAPAETVKETAAQESEGETQKESEPEETGRGSSVLKGGDTVSVMTGTVLDAAMNSIVIQNEEYPSGLIFSKEDSAAGFSEGLTLDMNVTLFYTGKVEGDDTSGANTVLVRESRDSDDTLTAAAVSGTVVETDGEKMILETGENSEGDAKETVEIDSSSPFAYMKGSEITWDGAPETGDEVTVLYSCPGGDENQKEAELVIEES